MSTHICIAKNVTENISKIILSVVVNYSSVEMTGN